MKAYSTHIYSTILCLLFCINANGQKILEHVDVSVSQAKLIGKTEPIRDLVARPITSKEAKAKFKRARQKPDNFLFRRGHSKVMLPELEHQGPDPIRQFDQPKSDGIEPLVNINGIGAGSPNDPTGDIGVDYYMQAVNATLVGVYDKSGNEVQRFNMSTLWSELGEQSLGDPIILFDEDASRWIVTEFSGPAKLLIAVSDTSDPLGSYNAYVFSTPSFPDYPKYAVWPNALVVTTNEGGGGNLHQYFFDRAALLDGAPSVTMQRIEVMGNWNTEAGFFVSTPVDWNGRTAPSSANPMTMRLNDSSWGAIANDALEIYEYDIDWDNPNNTEVINTTLEMTPYDSYPCSAQQFGFSCTPQSGGEVGLDAIPEVIMNVPFYYNFGTHESIVFNFITDLTNGDNISGIRWVELRKTASEDWSVYQEGTFGPDDGLDRFMGSIAMDKQGNIAMGYNVSGDDIFAGVRFTGRFATDPLGQMTIPECNVIDGLNYINSGGRFGDYAQMSLDPVDQKTFWYTTEYAAGGSSRTRIVAFQLGRDSFDLAMNAFVSPSTSPSLTDQEIVMVNVVNNGLNPIANFEVSYDLDGTMMDSKSIGDVLMPDSILTVTFDVPADLTDNRNYVFKSYVSHPDDLAAYNDTIVTDVNHQLDRDASVELMVDSLICQEEIELIIALNNEGAEDIFAVEVEISLNAVPIDTVELNALIEFGNQIDFDYDLDDFVLGDNEVSASILSVNGTPDQRLSNDVSTKEFRSNGPDGAFVLVIILDNFPNDTSWDLTDNETGEVIASDGPFEDGNNLVTRAFCVDESKCYTFGIYDSAGDGICCSNGSGQYFIQEINGTSNLVAGDGMFGDEEITVFCPGLDCMLTATTDITQPSFSGATDGAILITAANGSAPYQYSIDGGTTLQSDPLFENLPEGIYEIYVISSEGVCTHQEQVELETTSSTSDSNNEFEIIVAPNPNDGYFKVELISGASQFDEMSLQILNANGQVIFATEMAKYNTDFVAPISLVSYPAGNYFVRFKESKINQLVKIVKH